MMLMMLGAGASVYAAGTKDIVADGTKQSASADTAETTAGQQQTVTTVQNVVTGYANDSYLYIITLTAGFGVLCLMTHLKLNRVRNGKR